MLRRERKVDSGSPQEHLSPHRTQFSAIILFHHTTNNYLTLNTD